MAEEINNDRQNSDEIHDIITAIPPWILRWGITLILVILLAIITLSALINYPDIVKTSLKVNSLNSPKVLLAKVNGKIISLLVKDGQMVKNGQHLAYLESTASTKDVILMHEQLKIFQKNVLTTDDFSFVLPKALNLGELQGAYQGFYQQYLEYKSTLKNGYYLSRMAYLNKELKDITALNKQIEIQREIQQLEYANKEMEYKSYKKLYSDKVISRSEFTEQENKYLASKYPLEQTKTSSLNNSSIYTAKEKEVLELQHTITQEKAKFLQALNQIITENEMWILQHIIRSPIDGKVTFAGIVQENQNVAMEQELFIINPGRSDFFGEVRIPQYNMGKIRVGQNTLIKLHSYPYEQYGLIRGKLSYISDAAYQDSIFIAKIDFKRFENKDPERKITLKNGMQADAEIITEESSLLKRFFRNVNKIIY